MNRFKCPACGRNQYTSADTQEKKIRIATVDRCVMCGNPVPEGQQVCGLCKHKTELEETISCIEKQDLFL